jgi:hypothetical protein
VLEGLKPGEEVVTSANSSSTRRAISRQRSKPSVSPDRRHDIGNHSLFGLLAVTLMLIFYALEDRSEWFILAFAGACALGSIYGFLRGA